MPCALLAWSVLLALVLLLPAGPQGEQAIRNSIRLALFYYTLSLSLQLRGGAVALCRWTWTLAWLAYAIHVVLAFHHFHRWSHAHAVEHVREAGGFGEGIWASHVFGLVWAGDVVWWWLAAKSYSARPAGVTRALHGFMLFMVFNAAIVFATGLGRWLGVALFAVLLWMWRTRDRGSTTAVRPAAEPGRAAPGAE